MTTYLAIDLGTTTGWAVGTPSAQRADRRRGVVMGFGEENFGKQSRFEGGGMRYLRFSAWLDSIYAAQAFDQVAFEEVRGHKGTDAAHIYGGLLATLTTWCERRSIPYQGVPVQHIKKHATGKGNANKEVMIHVMESRGHQLNGKLDNAADALAVLYWMFDNATPCPADKRHSLHRESLRRVPLDLVALAAKGRGRRAR